MIEIVGKLILWHIIKIYSSHGTNDFIICCDYKEYSIKEYFAKGLRKQTCVRHMLPKPLGNYFFHMTDSLGNYTEMRKRDSNRHKLKNSL
jgi:NDP-sugar pyrophosphorylase family protein